MDSLECLYISREVDRMSDIMESFVKKTMESNIKEKYPHLQFPSGMYAKVVRVQKSGDIFNYTIKILDKNLNDNNDFPEIPNVKSELELYKNDIAVVILLYGGNHFYILGRRNQ